MQCLLGCQVYACLALQVQLAAGCSLGLLPGGAARAAELLLGTLHGCRMLCLQQQSLSPHAALRAPGILLATQITILACVSHSRIRIQRPGAGPPVHPACDSLLRPALNANGQPCT